MPAECDLVIIIFWSRIGTPLPADWKKLDGSDYLSGIGEEYLNALQAAEQNGKPIIIKAKLDANIYSRGISVTDDELNSV